MSSNLWITENYVNVTEDYSFGSSEPYETFTNDLGELYRSLQKEFGRCTGAVYVDTKDGKTKKVGWCFVSRQRYEDARSKEDTYLREVWVTVVKPTGLPQYETVEIK